MSRVCQQQIFLAAWSQISTGRIEDVNGRLRGCVNMVCQHIIHTYTYTCTNTYTHTYTCTHTDTLFASYCHTLVVTRRQYHQVPTPRVSVAGRSFNGNLFGRFVATIDSEEWQRVVSRGQRERRGQGLDQDVLSALMAIFLAVSQLSQCVWGREQREGRVGGS